MKSYQGSEIRNVAVVGHAHSGKTTLVSALLHAAKMTPQLGRVEDGSAVTAYDEEEVSRRTTMQNAVAFAEWNGVKVNLVDTPGFHMFVHEAKSAMLPVEAAMVVVNTPCGVEAMTDRVWKYADEFNLPRVVVLNQMDHPRAAASVEPALEALRARYGRAVVPVQLPIANGKGFEGVVDLVTMEAFYYSPGGDGQGKIGEIPADMQAPAKAAHEALVELVAEGKDELMEEFFAEGTIAEQHLITALHEAIREDRIFPVLFSSGLANVATDHLLDFLKVYAPAPIEREPVAARAALTAVSANGHAANGPAASEPVVTGDGSHEIVMRKVDDKEPVSHLCLQDDDGSLRGAHHFFQGVFRSRKERCHGHTISGVVAPRGLLIFPSCKGHTAVPVTELHAGDLGAVAKLRDTLTGDTLGDKGHEIFFEPVALPEAAMTYAIEPKTRADEDKLAPAVHKLMEEDLLVRFFRDPQTNEFLIAGAGQPHIEAIVSKLRRRYHTEVTLKAPKVPYRETIRGRAEAHGRHKKQTGGHGQFGDCKIRIEPLTRGSGFEFINDIFGGAIPRNFIPAVEKGIQESAARGYLAGLSGCRFPRHALRRQLSRCRLERTVFQDGRPSGFPEMHGAGQTRTAGAGHARRDRSARGVCRQRSWAISISAGDEYRVWKAADQPQLFAPRCPMAEMLSYGSSLTAMTQGRGSFHMEMDHYDVVPQPIAEKILANAKRPPAKKTRSDP